MFLEERLEQSGETSEKSPCFKTLLSTMVRIDWIFAVFRVKKERVLQRTENAYVL